MTVSVICRVGRLGRDKPLVSGAVHVQPDGGDPVDSASVGHHGLVRSLLEVPVDKVMPVFNLGVRVEDSRSEIQLKTL